MNNNTTQKTFLLTSVMMIFGYSAATLAHDQSGALGKAKGAIDYYAVSCFDDGAGAVDRLELQVMDLPGVSAPSVSVQITKGNIAANTTDAIDGDTSYSPEAVVKGGNGTYYVTVDKNKAGKEEYSLQFHCVTATNEHAGTSVSPLQDQ